MKIAPQFSYAEPLCPVPPCTCLRPSLFYFLSPSFLSLWFSKHPCAFTHLGRDSKVCVCTHMYACAGACPRRAGEDVKGVKGRHKVRCKGKRRRPRCSGEQVEGLWFILWGFEREINLCLRRSPAPWSHCVPQIDLEKWMLSSEREGWSLKEKKGGRRKTRMDEGEEDGKIGKEG